MTDAAPANVTFWAKHGRTVLALALVAAGLAYVLQQVNPETVAEFRVQQARDEAKREIRWCLGVNALRGGTALDALECAND